MTGRIDAAQEPLPPGHPATKKRKSLAWRIVQILLAVVVVLLCFLYAIPKFASSSEVWTEVKTMTPLEILLLLLATALNLVTYWWQNMVSIPNLSLWKAAVNNQTSTSVANTMAGGAYVAVAVSCEMYRAWGYKGSDVGVSVAATSVLNIYAKLLLPAVALAPIVFTGRANGALSALRASGSSPSWAGSCWSGSPCGGSRSPTGSATDSRGSGREPCTW